MKLLATIGVLVLAWGTTGFISMQDQPDLKLAEQYFKTGEQLYREGKYRLAADTLKLSAAIFEQAEKTVDQVKAANLHAECLSNLNQCDAAAPILQQSLEIINSQSGDTRLLLADTYYYLSRNTGGCARKWDEAIKLMQKSLDLKKEIYAEGDVEFSSNYNFLGYIYNSKGKYDSAMIYLDHAMAILKTHLKGDDVEISHTMFNLAASYEGKSLLGKALESGLAALKIRTEKLGTLHPTVSNSINSIGRVYRKLGNNERALEYYRQALDIRKKTLGENHPNVAASYYEIGNLYGNISNYHASLEYIHEGNRILESNRQVANDVLPAYFAYEGKMYGLTGQHDLAKSMIAKAVAAAEMNLAADHPYRAIVYNIAGEYYGEVNDVAKQSEFSRKAIAIYQKSYGAGSEREGDVIAKMAATHAKLGNAHQAWKYYYDALDIFRNKLGELNPKVATVHLGIGDLYVSTQNQREALLSYDKALESIAGSENKPLEFKILRSKAKADIPVHAFESYDRALKLADEIAQGYTNDAARIQLEKDRREICEEAMAVAGQLYMVPEAFSIAEESKAVLLLENTKDQQAKTIAGVPDSLIEKERDLRIELAYYKTNLYQSQKNKDTAAIASFEKHIFASERQLEDFKSQLEHDFPAYFHLKYTKPGIGLADLMRQLPQKTSVLQYFVGKEFIYCFVISHDSVKLQTQYLGYKVKTNLHNYQKSLTDFSFIVSDQKKADSLHIESARALFQLLMIPKNAGEKLIIIPDDFLAQLNFGTLLSDSLTENNYATLPYLSNMYSVSYAYSSAFLGDNLRASQKRNNKFAGFAPSYTLVDYTSVDSAMHPMTALAMRSGHLPLPGAAEEVNMISKLMNGESWLDEDATETNFKLHGGDYGVLHLAMHSLLNDEEPRYSELLFNHNKDTINDGYLTIAEIYNLKLNAQMVVLSACSSGFGKIQHGEGPISLSRAFSYAGCPSVVMSLWKVPDLVTTKIMAGFYQNLSDGLPKDEALRKAQQKFVAENDDPLYRHPYYWAGFVVIGDTSPLESYSDLYYWLGGVVLAALGALILVRRK